MMLYVSLALGGLFVAFLLIGVVFTLKNRQPNWRRARKTRRRATTVMADSIYGSPVDFPSLNPSDNADALRRSTMPGSAAWSGKRSD